jgi:hypothetical protein
MLYLIIIFGSILVITTINAILLPATTAIEVGRIVLSTLLGTLSIIAWDGILAFLIRRCPLWKRCFTPDNAVFKVSKRERSFYRRIGIQNWKHSIPEFGLFAGAPKGDVINRGDTSYLGHCLTESHYGVAIHLFNALLGFLIIFLPWCAAPTIAVPIALVNMILSLLPMAVLRFNTLPLLGIYHSEQQSIFKKSLSVKLKS